MRRRAAALTALAAATPLDAIQGTLWRQRVGSAETRQLTDGPGYDAQPDWYRMDRLEAATRANGDWNSEGEREDALQLMRRARAEFERRLGAGSP